MKPLYYFDHEVESNDIPQFVTYAFDARYSALRVVSTKYVEDIFSDNLIREVGAEASILKVTYYWPKWCKIRWSKTDRPYVYRSEVICMKSKASGLPVGFELKEEWELDIKNKKIASIKEL